MQMLLVLFPSVPRKGVLFVKEYVNSSELSASPRYGRYEECPDAVVCLHTCAKQQRVALPANMHRASSKLEPLALCQHAVVPELISPEGIGWAESFAKAAALLWGPRRISLQSHCGNRRISVPQPLVEG